MPIRSIHLDGNAIRSMNALYDEISRTIPLPDYFGRNLDALADVLSTDIEGPFEIIWEHAAVSKKHMKSDYTKIVTMLKRIAAERSDVKVTFKH